MPSVTVNGTVFENLDRIADDTAWMAPANARLSDNNRATASLDAGASPSAFGTKYLKATGFGLENHIPAEAVITGIQVRIEKSQVYTTGSRNIEDESLYLVVGGEIQTAENKALTSTPWVTGDVYTTYGGEADTWSLNLTGADVAGSDFGLVFSCELESSGGSHITEARVDHIELTVFYDIGCTYPITAEELPRVRNGTGPEHIVKSSTMNRLADCMVEVQTVLLSAEDGTSTSVRPLGRFVENQNILYMFNITVTGTVPASGDVTFERLYKEVRFRPIVDRTVTENFTSRRWNSIPIANVNCFWVSAVGWVTTAGGLTVPAFVSPRSLILRTDPPADYIPLVYSFGFRATGRTVYGTATEYSTGSQSANTVLQGMYITPADLPPGTLRVKMTALAQGSP